MFVPLVWAGLLPVLACADDADGKPGETMTLPLTIWNQSEFELLEIRDHLEPNAVGAVNRLTAPLAVDGLFEIADFLSPGYITVLRVTNNLSGQRIAVTTESPISPQGPDYTLMVLTEGFVLLEPDSPAQPARP